jgi:Zn-dependent protease/CBS domain-containing protein
MKDSIRLLTVRGIVIRIHLTFPLILVWAVLQFGVFTGQGVVGAIFGIVVTLLLFAVVVLHELGHSIAAQNYGVPVKEIVLLPLGGVARLERIPENPMQEFVIAIAGPAVNFVIAGLLLIVNQLLGIGSPLTDLSLMVARIESRGLDAVFDYIFTANLLLAAFNLLPAFPLDGGRVLRALLASRMEYARATSIAVSVGQGLAWLLGLWGFLGGNFFLIIIAIFIYFAGGQEGQMVQFRRVFGNLKVRQAYSRQAQTLAPQATLQEAVERLLTSFQADFPVCDGDQLVGLVTYTRLVESLNHVAPETPVQQIMQSDITPAQPDDDLFDVQQRMMAEHLEALPVVHNGRFLGLLTNRDVAEVYRLLSRQPGLIDDTPQRI